MSVTGQGQIKARLARVNSASPNQMKSLIVQMAVVLTLVGGTEGSASWGMWASTQVFTRSIEPESV